MRFESVGEVPDEPEITIEVARGGFVKHRPDGSVDLVSPLPCPYNYGSIAGHVAPDGAPLDALVMGERLRVGTLVRARVRAVYGFIDEGVLDPKVVCSTEPLTVKERRGIDRFFKAYVLLKRALQKVRGGKGRIAALGWLAREDGG
jgi:inorganic pyrophosphatase